ncbi:MAG: hypothetical protein H7X80_08280 [bacterium]|nr:hypothetical protein [Candidatus Kapabacteria bacterium]
MIEVAATIAVALLIALGVFQLLLVFGVPLGRFAWGGSHNVLPAKLRAASAVSIVLYALFAIIILEAAFMTSLVADDSPENIWIWVLFGYFTVGVVMNAISRSKSERNLMTPVAALLAVACLIVALQ